VVSFLVRLRDYVFFRGSANMSPGVVLKAPRGMEYFNDSRSVHILLGDSRRLARLDFA
jgi:hypothetical protein